MNISDTTREKTTTFQGSLPVDIKIDLPTNTLIIKNEGEDLKTIKSVYLNGEKMNSLWLELDQIDGGGIIQLNKLN